MQHVGEAVVRPLEGALQDAKMLGETARLADVAAQEKGIGLRFGQRDDEPGESGGSEELEVDVGSPGDSHFTPGTVPLSLPGRGGRGEGWA